MSRIIAIGDIHGCADALSSLIDIVQPHEEDTIVQLGDMIDRGPDSQRVVEMLISLSKACKLIVLFGDHEELMLDAIDKSETIPRWLRNGGGETMKSYGWNSGQVSSIAPFIPQSHSQLLRRAYPYYETDSHIFVHAGYVPELPMCDQPGLALRWRVCHASTSAPHFSGKTAIVGHTAQKSCAILDLGFLKCIDTNCVRGGWLTALDVDSGKAWQANEFGQTREFQD